MALFWVAIKINSVFLWKFPFFSHVQAFSCEVSLVCRLKYPELFFFSFLFSNCCSVDHSVVCAVSGCYNKCFFALFRHSSIPCIDASTLSSMVTSSLPPSFLDTYSISQRGKPRCLSLWWDSDCRAWFRVVFVRDTFLSLFLSSPLVWWCPLPIFLNT